MRLYASNISANLQFFLIVPKSNLYFFSLMDSDISLIFHLYVYLSMLLLVTLVSTGLTIPSDTYQR